MHLMTKASVLLGILALGACTVPPPQGPSVGVTPGPGKSFEAFQQDDAVCRQYAVQGATSASEAQTNSAITSAAVGTVIGAAAGAALGAAAGNAGVGAAAGAGTGLLVGGAGGLGASQASASAAQHQYDMRYEQCMYAKGEGTGPAVTPAPSYGSTVAPVPQGGTVTPVPQGGIVTPAP
jgi:hypothetical protein